ncbi:MAG: GH3 auxin-responsive promoter family protein [Bacteroidales bacterium]|nr:GH3 auxin-responsive promoter family protein [Bacteroidales bacterium]
MKITPLVRPFFAKRIKEMNSFLNNGEVIQKKVLASLTTAAKDTEIGRKYGFSEIKDNYRIFAERLPVIDYEGVKPYVERMLAGEQNLIWNTKIGWFAKSSGTTNDKSKFIPVSDEARRECHYKGGKSCVASYLNLNPNSRIFDGKALILGGSHEISKLAGHYHCGDLSAILIQNMPSLANYVRVPSKQVALMSEWESKLEKIAATTVNENVTNLSGVPSWFMVLIKKMLNDNGKQYLTEIWPNLELFFHGGISFAPYREQYKRLIPSEKMNYLETYNASEGFFAVQNSFDEQSMLLLIDLGIFFEFIPMSEVGSDSPKVLPYWEVEKGENYALVITTNSGLWRYMIGDTVRVESVNPVKITISGRVKHFINAFGEELMVDNAEKGLAKTCEKTGAHITNYTAAPVFMSEGSRGRHQWLIEFDREPSSLDEFANILDASLQDINSDYEAKRYKGIALERLEIIPARKGLFEDWLRNKGKLGGQHKVPRLSNNRTYIDDMLKLNK